MADYRMTVKPEKVKPYESFSVTVYDDPRYGHTVIMNANEGIYQLDFPPGASEQTKTLLITPDIIDHFPADAKEITAFFSATQTETPYPKRVTAEAKITLEGYPQAKPKITVKDAPVSDLPAQFSGVYIRSKSKLSLTIKATPAAGTQISYKEVKVGSSKWERVNGDVYQTDYELGVAGTREYVVRCVDKRGFAAEITQTIDVIPYDSPIVATGPTGKLSAYRCLPDGTAIPNGANIRILAGRIYSNVKINGSQKNFCALRYRIKKDGQEYPAWSDLIPADSLGSDRVDKIISNAAADIKSRYTVQIGVFDTIGEERITTIQIPADLTPFHLGEGGKNVGIGQYCNYAHQYAVDIGWRVYFNRGLAPRTVFTTEYSNSAKWKQGQKLKSFYPDADLSMIQSTHVFLAVIHIINARHAYIPMVHIPGSVSAGVSNLTILQGFSAVADDKVLKQFPIEFQMVDTNGEPDLLFNPIRIDGMQNVEIAGLFALI